MIINILLAKTFFFFLSWTSLSDQRKQLTEFVANDNIQALKQ